MEDIDKYASKISFLENTGSDFLSKLEKSQNDFSQTNDHIEASINSLKQSIQILNLELHQVKLQLLQAIKLLRERARNKDYVNVKNKVENWDLHEKITKAEFINLLRKT